MIKPNYTNLGLSYTMGESLRKEVEKQLNEDIRHYGINNEILKYDWSESVIEGKSAKVLDSYISNYSDIRVFNYADEIIAEGWIDFIYEAKYNLLIFYWDQLDLYDDGIPVEVKKFGIPDYIINELSDDFKIKYNK